VLVRPAPNTSSTSRVYSGVHEATWAEEIPLTTAASPEERLGALFDAHHRRLHRLGLRLLGDTEEARDLVQETFVRAAAAIGRIPDGEPAGEAWLVRVAVNLCRDRHRRRAVRRAHAGPMPIDAAGADEEPSRVARWLVRAALLDLPPRRRAILVLHAIEGRSAREIAALLGTTAVTVRWHLSVARREMSRRMRGVDVTSEENP
jgi:RNA polymerase sigma factor (sigma-70 family)